MFETAIFLKIKAYLVAVFIGFVSSSVRYIEHKRQVRLGISKKKIKIIEPMDWFLFGCMASVITTTGVALIEYMGYEFSSPMIAVIFWMGYMTDYLFQWIPVFLKNKLDKYITK